MIQVLVLKKYKREKMSQSKSMNLIQMISQMMILSKMMILNLTKVRNKMIRKKVKNIKVNPIIKQMLRTLIVANLNFLFKDSHIILTKVV